MKIQPFVFDGASFYTLLYVLIVNFVLTWGIDNRTLLLNNGVPEILQGDSIVIDELHSKGVEAYLNNDWDDCIKYFTIAANQHRAFRKAVAKCRIRCRSKSNVEPHLLPIDIENLHFYETAVRTTLCLLKCKRISLKNKYVSITPSLDKLYLKLKPYEFLHLCYYQKKIFQEAASACFTALTANPDDEIMIQNFEFYTSLPEVNINKIVNMETKDFVPLYIQGIEAYNRGDFAFAINFFEKSLKKWLLASEECRAYCEGPFDQGWFPDFIPSLSNHFTFCLRCKNKCETSLNSLNGEYHDDMLPSHYNYLQYSYYKVSDLQKACEAVESYLLFFPNEESVLKNKEFYMQNHVEDMNYFIPRQEALKYVERRKYENKLLNFIDTEFRKFAEKTDIVNHENEGNVSNLCLIENPREG